MTILEYLSLYASAAKWGDWQCIPGLWEHLQRMWDFHRWRHGGSCTPWDAWRCGDRQRNRGHTTWPWRWRDKVSTFSTDNRDSTKLSWWIYIWFILFIKKSLFLYHFLYIWYWWYFLFLKSPVVITLRRGRLALSLHITSHGFQRPGCLYLDHQRGSKQPLCNSFNTFKANVNRAAILCPVTKNPPLFHSQQGHGPLMFPVSVNRSTHS